MRYLNFQEHILSKLELVSSLTNDPIVIKSYKLNKYCKISIGKCINTKDMFILKPKDIIKVKWNYKDKKEPICLKMIILNIECDVYWKNDKIQYWLEKNTKEV